MNDHLMFIKSLFEMETGLKVLNVTQIGFSKYRVNTEDGSQYLYRG